MKAILSATILAFSLNSLALEVFNCEVSSSNKEAKSSLWNKKMFISKNFSNKITFGRTELSLSLDENLNIKGLVNNQPNFFLSGNVEEASFQSAFHQGTINCGKELEVSHLFKFRPWDQYFSLDSTLSKGHIIKSISTQDLKYNMICFEGDINEANNAISTNIGLRGIQTSPYDIEFSFSDEECVSGYGGMDDWTCTQTQTKIITRTVSNCSENQDSRI